MVNYVRARDDVEMDGSVCCATRVGKDEGVFFLDGVLEKYGVQL
jgi:hypothetical protein